MVGGALTKPVECHVPPTKLLAAAVCRYVPFGGFSCVVEGVHLGGRLPDVPRPRLPERLRSREASPLRGGAVPRAHDARPQVEGVDSALT